MIFDKATRLIIIMAAVLALLVGCGDDSEKKVDVVSRPDVISDPPSNATASATISPTVLADAGVNTVMGTATFTKNGSTVSLQVTLTNCPAGKHGVHIHTGATCGTDGAAAGAHWDPGAAGATGHGQIGQTATFHLGDIGNIECSSTGAGSLSFSSSLWTIKDGNVNSDVSGRTIVVHAMEDNFGNMPANGNSGARIGCGSIQ